MTTTKNGFEFLAWAINFEADAARLGRPLLQHAKKCRGYAKRFNGRAVADLDALIAVLTGKAVR